jgi:hypothetical protein
MYNHDVYYRQALERAEAIRNELARERLVPRPSFRARVALSLHRLADRLEPKRSAEPLSY